MSQSSQAELFARSFQSQVARHPGAACVILPLLRSLGVDEAVNAPCASGHTVPHGPIVTLLIMNRLQAPQPLYQVQNWLAQSGLRRCWTYKPAKRMIRAWARRSMRSTRATKRSGKRWC